MSLGRVLLIAAGAAAGVAVYYAVTRSGSVREATKATIRAGAKASEWTKGKCDQAKGEFKALAKEALEEKPKKAKPAKAEQPA